MDHANIGVDYDKLLRVFMREIRASEPHNFSYMAPPWNSGPVKADLTPRESAQLLEIYRAEVDPEEEGPAVTE